MRKHHRRNRGGSTNNGSDVSDKNQTDHDEPEDNKHNGEIPVCQILSNAIEDIFPELQDRSIQSRKSLLAKKRQEEYSSESSTLGHMFRLKIFHDIKFKDFDTRVAQLGAESDRLGNRNSDSVLNETNQTSTSVISTKKKRKRKKKKKKQVPPVNLSNIDDHKTQKLNDNVNDGKSMMSADYSIEALDEAIKTENEKMIYQARNHQHPLLESLPSDDNCLHGEENSSRFIEKIIPQQNNTTPFDQNHGNQSHATITDKNNHLSIPKDCASPVDDYKFDPKMDPLRLLFLVAPLMAESTTFVDTDYLGYDKNDATTTNFAHTSENINIGKHNNEKEKSRMVFYEWIGRFPKSHNEENVVKSKYEKGDWDSFLEFCNHFTNGKERAVGIAFQALIDAASAIRCKSCRESTLLEIKALMNKARCTASSTKTSGVVMNSSLLEKPCLSSNQESDDIVSAFDYVELEEGHYKPITSSHRTGSVDEYDCFDEETVNSNISFALADLPVNSKIAGKRSTAKMKSSTNDLSTTEQFLFFEHITINQIDDFLYEWLVAGVDEEKLIETTISDEQEKLKNGSEISSIEFPIEKAESIKNEVIITQQHFISSLGELDVKMEKFGQELETDEKEMNLTFIRMDGITLRERIFRDCLTNCILPILTKKLSLTSHVDSDLQIYLWSVYLRTLAEMINVCDNYYKLLEDELADQNGKLPLICVNAPVRNAYNRCAKERVEVVLGAGNIFAQLLNTSRMKEFYTRFFWSCRTSDTACKQTKQLDEDCQKLVAVLMEWATVMQRSRISSINKERLQSLEDVFDNLRVVVESLGKEYDKVSTYFTNEQHDYFTSLLSNIRLADGIKDRMRLVEKEDIINLTTGVILMWRHVRIMQSRVTTSLASITLPLSLHQWMLQPLSMNSAEKNGSSQVYSKCLPGNVGGRRRFMGVLAGLTYSWLRERCNEWKAEKTTQELLTDFDQELLSSTHQQDSNATKSFNKSGKPSSRSSKKNKQKKIKPSGVSSDSEKDRKLIHSIEQTINSPTSRPTCTENNTVTRTKQELTSEPNLKNSKNTHNGRVANADNFEHVDEKISGQPGRKIAQHDHEESNDLHTTNGKKQSHNEQRINNHVENHSTSVVVRDESGCYISAADFLTDRLLSLMEEKEKENIMIIPI